MRASDCDSELLVEARRRTLTSTETLALRSHLAQCQLCRLAQQVVEDFNQEPAVVADDSSAILGMSETARRWVRQRDRRGVASRVGLRRPLRIGVMAASLVLIAGTVSAVWLWRQPQTADSPQGEQGGQRGQRGQRGKGWKGRMTAPVPVRQMFARAAPVAVTPAPEPTAPAPSPPSQPAGVRHPPRPMSAALLLQHATEARRRGDVAQAITLYRRLQQMFPTSSDAVLSAAPLGGLLLEGGATLPALDQFDRYLRAAPAGVLVPEALYGRGRALRALGDAAEERRTWRRLVSAFPDSPYAPLARRRLADLQ